MAVIEFGIWDHFERRLDVEPFEQYQQKIRLLQEAEHLGYYCYHLAEHHLTPLDVAPSPFVFLAALAQATSRIRVGTMVNILPLYHPTRLVQEICMLDNLSGGRLDVGVGPGTTRSIEFRWFGQHDRNLSRPIFEEALKVLVSAMTKRNLAYDGEYFKIEDAPMDLLPVQKPYPPIWYAAGDYAGRRCLNFFSRSFDDVAHYWDLWEEARHSPDRMNPSVEVPMAGVTKHVVIRENEQEAMKIARRAWRVFNEHWYATPLDAAVRPPSMSNIAGAVPDDFDQAIADNTRLLIGTPSTIKGFMERFMERFKDKPSVYFAPAMQWGDMTQEETLESLHLFATEVMPAFQPARAAAPKA